MAKRICLALQKKDREIALHGYESGRIVRLPGGEYIEVHEQLDEYERWKLVSYTDYKPLMIRPNAEGKITVSQRVRAALSGWFFEDRIEPVTKTEIERSSSHELVRASVRVASAVCTVLALSGCTSTTDTCVLWADYSTPQEKYDAATLVVVGRALPATSEQTLYGESVPRHEFIVTDVLKGEAPDPLWVSPAPVTCSGSVATAPLDTQATVILFLTRTDGVWHSITPRRRLRARSERRKPAVRDGAVVQSNVRLRKSAVEWYPRRS